MDITTTLVLSVQETNELARILECDPKDLPQKLSSYSAAAIREYVDMFLGKRVFKRGSDLNEYRLFLLIEEAFKNMIPDEQEVSHLFQTTTTESRSMIRSVMSKYQYQLKAAIDDSLLRIVQTAKQDTAGGPFTVIINSQNLVDELNRVLQEIDGSLPLVTKERLSVSTYKIPASSCAELRKHLTPA
jgi:hypothetical protein